MSLLTEQKKQLISCINEKLLDRRQLIETIKDYFQYLKPDETKEWSIKFKIGDYDSIKLHKKYVNQDVYKPKPRFMRKSKYQEKYLKYSRNITIYFHQDYSRMDYKHLDDVNLDILREFVKNLDNILVLMAAQDGCTLDGLGPVAVPTTTIDKIKENVDNFLNKEKEKEK